MAVDTEEWTDVAPPQQANSGPVSQGEADDEEWSDVASPEQSAPVQASGEDEWTDVPRPDAGNTPDQAGAFVREGARAIPAGIVGAEAGAAAFGPAAAASLPFAPLAGPLAPAVPFVVGGLAALAAGGGAAYLMSLGEDKLLALMGFDDQHQADAQTIGGKIGNIAGNVLPGAGMGKGLMLGARAVGAGLMGGISAGEQYARTGEIDPMDVALNAGAGAAFPQARSWVGKPTRLAGNLYRDATGRYRGGNKNPDLKETAAEDPQAQAPQEDEITVANDEPQVAAGVAVEQQAAPEITGAGNPEGAPMAAREAARASDPGRNYQKDQAQTQPETTESKVIDTEPMKSDIKAALEPITGEQGEQVPHPADGADVPPEQGAVPTNHPEPFTPEQEQANLAAQQEQHRQASALSPSVDPLEASQTQRQAAAGIKDRVAAQQKGEAFEGLDDAVPSPSVVPEQAPETLSPAEAKSLADDRRMMAGAKWDQLLKRLDELPPRKQFEVARDAANSIRKDMAAKDTAATREVRRPDGELRKESRQKTAETGVVAASKAEAERKNNALGAYKSVYEQFGPASERGKAIDPADVKQIKQSRAYAKEVWAEALKRLGGDPFKKGAKIYVPNKRTDTINEAVQWIKAVKASATNQNHKTFATLHNAPGLASEDRMTGRIEGDIKHKPQLPEAAEDTMTAQDAGADTSRVALEKWSDPEQMESKVYGEQQQKLRDWVNNLEDVDYRLLTGMHEDLPSNVNTTQDPHELLQNFQDDLAEAQARTPRGEVSSEVELPPRKVDVPNLPSREEDSPYTSKDGFKGAQAASPGKVISKGADEFQKVAAAYTAKPTKSKAQQLEDLKAKEEWAKRADVSTKELEADPMGADKPKAKAPPKAKTEPATPKAKQAAEVDKWLEGLSAEDKETFKSGWGDLADKVVKFAGDESGAGLSWTDMKAKGNALKASARKLGDDHLPVQVMDWFNPRNPAAPNALQPILDHANSIGGEFKRHIGREKNILMNLDASLAAAPALDNDRWSRIGRAVQNRATAALPNDLKKVYDDHVTPLINKSEALAKEIFEFNRDNKLGIEFPDPSIKGPAKDFMPRRKVGEQVYDKDEVNKFDPLSGRSLSVYSPSMIERDWMGLHNPKTNERLTVHREKQDDGSMKMTVWRGGKPQVLKGTPGALKGDVGDKLSLKIKGVKNDWLFDHASTDEIKAATGGKVAFHENPVMAYTQQIADLARTLNNMKLIKSITEDPRWEAHTTTSKNEAMVKGYDLNPVELDALGRRNGHPIFMPSNLRWALNDFFKQGYGGTNADTARRMTANVFKTFFALTPFVHPLNELDLAVVSRGSMWVTPEGTRSLIRNMPRAIQSVNKQDHIQQAINAFGGNPMLGSVKVRRMFPDAARRMGMDVTNNAPKWDPIAKLWGTSTADLAKNFYDASSDVTWRLSDYLLTLRVLENIDQGHSIESAVKDAHRFVSDYHVPPTVLGTGKGGRFIASTITEPFMVAFGRYKYGWLKAYANMTKDLVKGTPAQRNKAIGQMGVAMALAWMVYPAIDKGLQAISGNDKAEIGRRGFSTLPHALSETARTGNTAKAISAVVTPSPAVSMGMEAARNQDWNGKPIIPEGVDPITSPVRSGAYAADWAARNLVPPYNSISQNLVKEGGGVLPAAGHFLGEQVGAKFPTERAGKFEAQQERRINQQERQRFRRGEPGVIPDLYDRVTGRK